MSGAEATQAMFDRVTLQPGLGGGLALLTWSGEAAADRVVQIYVNGRLHDVAAAGWREAWLHVGDAAEYRVELLPVAAARAWTDFAHLLAGEEAIAKATAAVVRDESLPVDARVVVKVDGERAAEGRLWGPMDARSGFGGLFGYDAFGVSTATGNGHGLGEFGAAAFGADGEAWRWRGEHLAPGEHEIDVHVEDGAAVIVAEAEPRTMLVERLPRPAENVRLEAASVVWE